MARRNHTRIAGGLYHVTNRGVDKRDIVGDDNDRRQWFRLFHRVALRCGWRVFAHVLMTNHFHLFLKTPQPNLSAGMRDIESAYATYFNQRYDRAGTLFQGRFHPVLIESDGHLWSVSRYTHLNPCRACIASQPQNYHWSTYRFFIDTTSAPKWLDWRTVLCEFGGNTVAACNAYRRFVEAGTEGPAENPLASAFKGLLLGSDEFIKNHQHLVEDAEDDITQRTRTMTVEQVLDLVSQAFQVEIEAIQQPGRHGNWARDTAIWLCRQEARLSLKQVAELFGGISRGAVTDTVRRCEERQIRVPEYRMQCETIRRMK